MREHPLEVVSRVAEELRSSDAVSTQGYASAGAAAAAASRGPSRDVAARRARADSTASLGGLRHHAAVRAGECRRQPDRRRSLCRGAQFVMLGVGLALVAGKPIGVIGATWLAVRLGWCRLAPGVSWGGVCLVGLLAGIGFTMSIFIAMLAFTDEGSAECGETRCAVGLARRRDARPRLGRHLRSKPALKSKSDAWATWQGSTACPALPVPNGDR